MRRRSPVLASALAVTLAVAMSLVPGAAQAATATWIGNDFNWDAPLAWSTGSIPAAADDVILPTPIPVFPGASIGLAAGDVANSLTVNDTYTLYGGGTGTLTLGGAINVASAKTLTFDSVGVSGASAFSKLGAGTLTLATDSVLSGFTGIQLKAGTLTLDNATIDNANRVPDVALSLYGATLGLTGNGVTASTEAVGDTTLV